MRTALNLGQYTETVYFGKPCDLMDQMGPSVGGTMAIDFADRLSPAVERIEYDFSRSGHAELHHITRENISLIEVMGLAVLPDRLKEELTAAADTQVSVADLRADELTKKHADCMEGFKGKYEITAEKALNIVKKETSLVFAKVLEHAGVYARNERGKAAFLRFLTTVL